MADNLKELSDEALTHRLFDVERDLVRARFQHSLSQLENTAQLRVMRKDIARLRTEARRRELEQGLAKDSLVRNNRSSYGATESGEAAPAEERGGFLQGIVDKLTGNE